MGFSDLKYDITVKDNRTLEPITTGCYVFVYQAGTKTLATLYSDASRTTLANPITRASFATPGKIQFWTTETSVDITVNDDKGNLSVQTGFTPQDHTILLSRAGVDKCLIAPFIFNAGGTEVDTGLDIPVNTAIRSVVVEVVTTDATETIDVGLLSSETNGDVDGLIKLVPLDTAGFIRQYLITDGATEDYVGTTYVGDLIGIGSTGTNTANDFGQCGGWGHIVSGSNAKSLSYRPSTSDTGAGYIYVYFSHLR